MYSLKFQIVDKPVASLLGLRDSLKMQLISLNESVYEISPSDDFRDAKKISPLERTSQN